MAVQVKRVYEEPEPRDGYRVLVDRVWPRGLSKERAHFDEWLRDVAPSTQLRTWFGHDREKFAEFATRYRAELDENPKFETLRTIVREHEQVTLLYSARDTEANQAIVLSEYLGEAN